MPHDVGVRAAVKQALERADCADERRVDVGERRRRHARGKRRSVQLVIRVQHQRDVERARWPVALGPLAGQHVQEIRRMTEHRIRLDRTAAGRDSPQSLRRAKPSCAVRRTAFR